MYLSSITISFIFNYLPHTQPGCRRLTITILHPKTEQLYYWEHFGLMDSPGYCQNAFSKQQLYAAHGILPSVHLLTTYENQAYPLNTELVEKMIYYYFLR